LNQGGEFDEIKLPLYVHLIQCPYWHMWCIVLALNSSKCTFKR